MLPVILEAAIRSMALAGVIWLGLKALRIANPHILMAAWQMVLLASLLMPLLVGWVAFPVLSAALPICRTHSRSNRLFSSLRLRPRLCRKCRPCCLRPRRSSIGAWPAAIYRTVAAFLMLRLLIGSALTWRLCRWLRRFRRIGLPAATCAPAPASTCRRPLARRSSCLRATHAGMPRNAGPSWPTNMPMSATATLRFAAGGDQSGRVLVQPVGLVAPSPDRLSGGSKKRCGGDPGHRRSRALCGNPGRLRHQYEPRDDHSGHGRDNDRAPSRRAHSGRDDPAEKAGLARLVGGRRLHSPVRASRRSRRSAGTGAVAIAADRGFDAKSGCAARSSDGAEIAAAGSSDRSEHPRQLRRLLSARRLQITVTRQSDRLFVQLTGQETVAGLPGKPAEILLQPPPAQISFITDPQGRATGLLLHANGLENPAMRVDEAQAQSLEESFTTRRKGNARCPAPKWRYGDRSKPSSKANRTRAMTDRRGGNHTFANR